MPLCPVCRVTIEPIRYENVRIHNCGECGGHLLSRPNLDLILARRDVRMPDAVRERMLQLAAAANTRQRIWCQRCGAEMRKESFKHWNDIEIDRCARCGDIWLDRGELEKCQIYWEYAKDHPEEWCDEIVERKAQIELELRTRKLQRQQQREDAERWRDAGRGSDTAFILFGPLGPFS